MLKTARNSKPVKVLYSPNLERPVLKLMEDAKRAAIKALKQSIRLERQMAQQDIKIEKLIKALKSKWTHQYVCNAQIYKKTRPNGETEL